MRSLSRLSVYPLPGCDPLVFLLSLAVSFQVTTYDNLDALCDFLRQHAAALSGPYTNLRIYINACCTGDPIPAHQLPNYCKTALPGCIQSRRWFWSNPCIFGYLTPTVQPAGSGHCHLQFRGTFPGL